MYCISCQQFHNSILSFRFTSCAADWNVMGMKSISVISLYAFPDCHFQFMIISRRRTYLSYQWNTDRNTFGVVKDKKDVLLRTVSVKVAVRNNNWGKKKEIQRDTIWVLLKWANEKWIDDQGYESFIKGENRNWNGKVQYCQIFSSLGQAHDMFLVHLLLGLFVVSFFFVSFPCKREKKYLHSSWYINDSDHALPFPQLSSWSVCPEFVTASHLGETILYSVLSYFKFFFEGHKILFHTNSSILKSTFIYISFKLSESSKLMKRKRKLTA